MVKSVTKARLVRIGNSRGVRIPKPLIDQAGLRDEVDLAVHNGSVIIRSRYAPRAGWSEAFAAMRRRGDDELVDSPASSITMFDRTQWEWR
jgi:antitoxin MazE